MIWKLRLRNGCGPVRIRLHASTRRQVADVTAVTESGRVSNSRSAHVGRQAIYDRAGDVVAYELLFRHAADAMDAVSRGSAATASVMVDAFADFGIETLVGSRACFVNITREFAVGDLPVPFNPGQVGLELLDEVTVDDEVVKGVATLVEQGYTVSVDQFLVGQGRERLLPYASYAKIDMSCRDVDLVRDTVAICREYPHLELIAHRMETERCVGLALGMGFDLMQGNVLGRAHVVSIEVSDLDRALRRDVLRRLAAVTTSEEVLGIVEEGSTLAARLRRAVACTCESTRWPATLSEVLGCCGVEPVVRWAALMLAAED
jgi:c-di-GMP-related signal transduction protein